MKIKIIMDIETHDFGGEELLKEFQVLVADIDRSGETKIKTFEIITASYGHSHRNFKWQSEEGRL